MHYCRLMRKIPGGANFFVQICSSAIERFPHKPFHREILGAGLADRAASGVSDSDGQDRSHPYIAVDMARCIDCYRCVRICAELQGQFVWHLRDRGVETRIEPDGPNLRDSSCIACGACVDACPTGALEDKTASLLGAVSQWTRTTCPYCGVGCELSIGTHSGRIVSVRPVPDAPVSKGHLCVKGRYAFGFVSASDRMTEPMIRNGSGWRRVSWNEARGFVAERLRTLIERHRPNSIGVLGSARATNEDTYLTIRSP
jgi:formate dehydrogenase major subunit